MNNFQNSEVRKTNVRVKLDYQIKKRLPTMEELPYSDGKPVDSELQLAIADLLRSVLVNIWGNRYDWFFGVNMGWYYSPNEKAIAPHGFLSLGVERIKGENLRLSYVTWEENWVVPSLAIEVVSRTPEEEYKRKKRKYAEYGVLYYVIYAPMREGKQQLALYRLNREGKYELQEENPMWMPEIGLGIGTEVGTFQGVTREWLYWYDQLGNRYSSPEETLQQEQEARLLAEQCLEQAKFQGQQEQEARLLAEFQRQQEPAARLLAEQCLEQVEQQAELQRQQVEKMAARLRELGIDPDQLD
ncbi:MAG: Uma2 family endonuclease [Okeania sp. SIO3I5]|uniref:Uma2 family endonuclease n=1 Tax=Okeania sp. SIO3I5 TaxID=2607805 RepID=UPI0013BA7813|nr:Uma2 family endonuclease [Okeania sp. SIO3I5]NEQ37932.1 Uma2 family endonuclease [Okeania sp. SIO3I5]